MQNNDTRRCNVPKYPNSEGRWGACLPGEGLRARRERTTKIPPTWNAMRKNRVQPLRIIALYVSDGERLASRERKLRALPKPKRIERTVPAKKTAKFWSARGLPPLSLSAPTAPAHKRRRLHSHSPFSMSNFKFGIWNSLVIWIFVRPSNLNPPRLRPPFH